MRYVLDTSVLIENDGAIALGDEDSAAISVVSLSELHFGVLLTTDPAESARRLRRLATIENGLDALPVTDTIARIHGQMAATVAQAGRSPRRRSMDLLIAATAAGHGAALLTRNLDDFSGLGDFLAVLHPDQLSGV